MDVQNKWTLTVGPKTDGCIIDNKGGDYDSEKDARDAWEKLVKKHGADAFFDAFIFPPASGDGQPIILKRP